MGEHDIVIPENIKGDKEMEAAFLRSGKKKEPEEQKPVVVEEKPEEKPKEEVVAEKPDVKWSELLGEEFTDEQKVRDARIADRLKELRQLKEKTTEYEKQEKEYKSKLASVKSDIDDPDLARLNKLKKKNPDEYNLYVRLKFGDLNPVELMKMQFISENPEYKDKHEKVDAFIKREYKLNLQPLSVEDSEEDAVRDRLEEIEANEVRLSRDANRYKKELLSKFDSIEVDAVETTPSQHDVEKEKSERRQAWKPIAEKIVENFTRLPVMVQHNNDKEAKEFMSYDVSDEIKSTLAAKTLDYLVENNLSFEKESLNRAANYIMADFVIDNLPKINHALMEKARSMADEEWEKLAHNPSAKVDPAQRDKEAVLSKYDESRKAALDAER